MASAGNIVSEVEENGQDKNTSHEQNIYFRRLLALRRMRAMESSHSLISAFAILCCVVVLVTYLETSRMLLPTRVVSKQELQSLTAGFTNDLPRKDSKNQEPWSSNLHLRPHRPRALLVGFSHCGGRSILSALSSHPDVVVNKKEVKYFTAGNGPLRWYVSHMPPSLDHHMTVDVCWSCITNRTALTRIRSYNETIRIIVIVCDPISRLLASHIKLSAHFQDKDPIEFLKSRIAVNYSLLNNLNAQMLTESGDYFRHIVDLHELFNRKQVLILERERFRKHFVSELYRIHKFLGVKPHIEMHGLSYNQDKNLMCYSFKFGTQTCIDDLSQNLTEEFAAETGLLKSLKQFYKPFNRRLFLYLDNKYNWGH